MLQAIEVWVMLSGAGLFIIGWWCGVLWLEASSASDIGESNQG